jgi:hypothetical protein
MSVQELEQQVQALPPEELARFSQWFEGFRQQTPGAVSQPNEEVVDLTEEDEAELLRRVEFARGHPEALEPWEGTTDRIRQRLHALRAQKTAAS